MDYLDRVRDNVLVLSLSSDVRSALNEWDFTDEVVDHCKPIQACELCDTQGLRYHFEIANRNTQESLWVGSTCILRFDLGVYENGVLLDRIGAKRKLTILMEKLRFESCLIALREVNASEGNVILTNALKYLLKNSYLTPKFAFVVLWRLQVNRIDHNPRHFRVRLKTDRHKADFAGMEKSKVDVIWPALSSSQRKLAKRLGHSSPKD